jgi:hypothetical protein
MIWSWPTFFAYFVMVFICALARFALSAEMIEKCGPEIGSWWPLKILISSIISGGLVAALLTAMLPAMTGYFDFFPK